MPAQGVYVFRRKRQRSGATLQFEDATGRVRQKAFRSRRAAEEEARRLRLTPDPGRHPTLREYSEEWMRAVRPNLRQGPARMYAWALDSHILPELGQLEVQEISRTHVKNFLTGKLESGLARKTVSNIKGVLHACLGEAIEDGLIQSNPATVRGRAKTLRLTPTRAERAAKVKALDAKQMRLFLEKCQRALPDRLLLFGLMAFTGLRTGEALALCWEDLDLEARRVLVRRSWTSGRIEPTKTGHEREVDLPSRICEDLKGWGAETKAAALAAGQPRPPWLFPSKTGGPLHHALVQQDFKRALRAAGLPEHFTPHSLRHSYASLMLTRGESVYYVQRQLGHATITMTTDLYGRWLPAGNPKAADRLADDVLEPVARRNARKEG